jgi:phosphoribosylformylglycinamidine synthase
LVLALHVMVPLTRLTRASSFYNDEREQFFSNSLHPELYADRLDVAELALALASQPWPWLSLGVGATLNLANQADAPTYVRDGVKPSWLDEIQSFDFAKSDAGHWSMDPGKLQSPASSHQPRGVPDLLLDLLASPEIASKRLVWRQYDHQVGTNTVVGPGSDAAVVRIKDTEKAIAISTDGNAAYTYLDPYVGGAIAVCEAARNVVCAGARPLAMTNCLNFGNPEKPDGYYQLSEAIRGMSEAARALDIAVISGNVSLYNETNGEAIWPTPVVGVVGLIEDVDRVVPMAFQREGDIIVLAGTPAISLDASQALALRGIVAGRPAVDLEAEVRLQRALMSAVEAGVLSSAHDVSSGGVLVAVAESCMAGQVGAHLGEMDAVGAFGEAQSTAVMTCIPANQARLGDLLDEHGVPARAIGIVGGSELVLGAHRIPLTALSDAYESGLPRALEGVAANV